MSAKDPLNEDEERRMAALIERGAQTRAGVLSILQEVTGSSLELDALMAVVAERTMACLLYTSPSPRD